MIQVATLLIFWQGCIHKIVEFGYSTLKQYLPRKKIEKFVDSAVAEKGYGYYRVIAKGSKSDLHKATDVMIKHFSEQVELDEGKKGKYQSKSLKNVAKELAKVEKIEKKNKGQDREVKDIAKFVSKNLETEMYDDMEILSGRTLKQLDKMISKLDTDVRDGVAKAIEKADPDLYDMMFGFQYHEYIPRVKRKERYPNQRR